MIKHILHIPSGEMYPVSISDKFWNMKLETMDILRKAQSEEHIPVTIQYGDFFLHFDTKFDEFLFKCVSNQEQYKYINYNVQISVLSDEFEIL